MPGEMGPGGKAIPGGGADMSPEVLATRRAERMHSGARLVLLDLLIEWLENKAQGPSTPGG